MLQEKFPSVDQMLIQIESLLVKLGEGIRKRDASS